MKRFKMFFIAVAMMMPAMGWCVNGSNMNYVYTAEDKMGFAALGIAVLVILLVFAVIFFSINHRTKREKMHLDLLMEMVKMGFVPTSEQVAEKKVTDARIALDEKFNMTLKRKSTFSLSRLFFFIIGLILLILAFDVREDVAKFYGIAGIYILIYCLMEFRNSSFLLNNIAVFGYVNVVIGGAFVLYGLFFGRNFADLFFPCFLPGGYIFYYGIRGLYSAKNLPRYEFKIKKVEQNNVAAGNECVVDDKTTLVNDEDLD